MSRTRYTEQADEIIKEIYPKHGSRACVEAIYDRTGIEYRIEQIASRARKRLKLCRSSVFQRVLPQNQIAPPMWRDHPEGFVGPCPHKIGTNVIVEYLGLAQRGKTGRVQHFYRVLCTHCGKIDRKLQVSLVDAAKKDVKGCTHCGPRLRVSSLKEERERRAQWELEQRQKHMWLMSLMKLSSVPLTLSPEFDFYR